MNSHDLKQTIKEDISLLKTLEFEIFPARIYYGGLFKLIGSCFWKISLIAFLSMLYVDYSVASYYNPKPFMELFTDAFISSFFLSLIGQLMLIPMLTQYYLIQIHLQHRIKTGQLLIAKLKQVGWVFLGIFSLCAFLATQCMEPFAFKIYLGFSYFAALMVTYTLLSLEMNRIGVGVLFDLVNQWVNKD